MVDASLRLQAAKEDSAVYIRLLLARQPHLLALPATHLDALAFAFVETRYREGQFLIHRGSREPSVFLVLQGEVAKENTLASYSYRSGELLGSPSCMAGGRAEHNYYTLGPLRVAKLGAPAVRMLVGANSEMGHALTRSCEEPPHSEFQIQAAA